MDGDAKGLRAIPKSISRRHGAQHGSFTCGPTSGIGLGEILDVVRGLSTPLLLREQQVGSTAS